MQHAGLELRLSGDFLTASSTPTAALQGERDSGAGRHLAKRPRAAEQPRAGREVALLLQPRSILLHGSRSRGRTPARRGQSWTLGSKPLLGGAGAEELRYLLLHQKLLSDQINPSRSIPPSRQQEIFPSYGTMSLNFMEQLMFFQCKVPLKYRILLAKSMMCAETVPHGF